MRFTKESENALGCLSFLARRPIDAIVQASDIAEALDVSPAFMSKILQKLARAGIVRGNRGNPRGYGLARRPERISVRAVLEAIEGEDLFERCLFGLASCSDEHACTLHSMWRKARPQLRSTLADLSVSDLARRRKPLTRGI
jgi:Rrf2 family protein